MSEPTMSETKMSEIQNLMKQWGETRRTAAVELSLIESQLSDEFALSAFWPHLQAALWSQSRLPECSGVNLWVLQGVSPSYPDPDWWFVYVAGRADTKPVCCALCVVPRALIDMPAESFTPSHFLGWLSGGGPQQQYAQYLRWNDRDSNIAIFKRQNLVRDLDTLIRVLSKASTTTVIQAFEQLQRQWPLD